MEKHGFIKKVAGPFNRCSEHGRSQVYDVVRVWAKRLMVKSRTSW